jgi:hypothetical protein
MIRRSRVRDNREQAELVLLAIAGIVDGVVALVSLGYLTSDLRPWLLFDAPSWLIRDDK